MSKASFRVLLSEEQIQKRILELGAQIDADYPEGPIYLIAILKGACFFLADLARALKHQARLNRWQRAQEGPGRAGAAKGSPPQPIWH